MKRLKFILLLTVLSLMLSGCGYWVVESAPIEVGSPVHIVTPVPTQVP